MPSDRKQLNIRLDPETEAMVAELIPAVSQAIGLNVSQSDLFRLGLIELRRKYLPDAATQTSKPKGKVK